MQKVHIDEVRVDNAYLHFLIDPEHGHGHWTSPPIVDLIDEASNACGGKFGSLFEQASHFCQDHRRKKYQGVLSTSDTEKP